MPIDYAKYHPKWSLICYLIKTKRAQNRCERCGAINYYIDPLSDKRIVLSICHLDHNIINNRFANLACLCQKYHLKHDRAQHTLGKRYGKAHRERQISLFNTDQAS